MRLIGVNLVQVLLQDPDFMQDLGFDTVRSAG
jgi:hypothetical protein